MGSRRLWTTAATISLMIAFSSTFVHGATARPAKDLVEQRKAITAATQFLQGHGFTDPMVSAETFENRMLTVTVDTKGWTRMNKAQKIEFLDRINGGALNASGGVAIDIHVSMSGTKVATSSFAGGQQSLRLLE